MIATHVVVFLEVTDDGLDRSPPLELVLDLRRDAALLAAKFTLFSIDFFLQKAPATSV